jgi:5-amino-6-(5-phosphoribosylamino)uracil reductase
VADRPYTILSCAVSADGCLDDTSPHRLILSGPEDLDEVDALRAAADAILVGAGTIRADNPRLLVRSPARGAVREAAGRPPHPRRVTLTAGGDLDQGARFFAGPGDRPLVYCASSAAGPTAERLGATAEVIGAGDPPSLATVFKDLYAERMIATLLVEGGARILRDALAGDLADELRLAVAPFFVGDPGAPRFGLPALYPHGPRSPMRLISARPLAGVAVLTYRLTPRPRPETLPSPRGGRE